uniref:Uncharacterized protein n=1 Tax=Arundo donax TaxID=35708 RepID=A0A0A9R228_ARUDO
MQVLSDVYSNICILVVALSIVYIWVWLVYACDFFLACQLPGYLDIRPSC